MHREVGRSMCAGLGLGSPDADMAHAICEWFVRCGDIWARPVSVSLSDVSSACSVVGSFHFWLPGLAAQRSSRHWWFVLVPLGLALHDHWVPCFAVCVSLGARPQLCRVRAKQRVAAPPRKSSAMQRCRSNANGRAGCCCFGSYRFAMSVRLRLAHAINSLATNMPS